VAREIQRLKRLIDLMDRPEGADIGELRNAYSGSNGVPVHVITIERVLSYLRNKAHLTIVTRGFRCKIHSNCTTYSTRN